MRNQNSLLKRILGQNMMEKWPLKRPRMWWEDVVKKAWKL